VAVEKVGFSEKSRKSGDRKCPGDWEKSLVELPEAKQFLRNRSERFFNSHRDYHHLSRFEIDGGKRISQHLSKLEPLIRTRTSQPVYQKQFRLPG
jgi:hypothetical protein